MGKFILGLLVGVGLGAIMGLLFAPQSGAATRAQLSEQGILLTSNALGEDLRARANDAMAQGRELYARTKGDLTDRYNKSLAGEL
ncbi:MAG TPA: YtxH domain-containing protein [Ktedonobacteraceae bacterium]|nr:YtxH domain-containing protein [Ktedonobacteraceae bacterium]